MVNNITRDRRVTESDQLSSIGIYCDSTILRCVSEWFNIQPPMIGLFIGGILGLFNGMSIISLFELPFWFAKIVHSLILRHNR